MGEVIQFIPKGERERIRLIREARAIYDGVFPSSYSANEQRDRCNRYHDSVEQALGLALLGQQFGGTFPPITIAPFAIQQQPGGFYISPPTDFSYNG